MNLLFNKNSFKGWDNQYKSWQIKFINNYFNNLGYIKSCNLFYKEFQYSSESETDIIRVIDIQIEESIYVMMKLLDELKLIKDELNSIGYHKLIINGEEI